MQNKWDKVWTGLAPGLIAPIILLAFYWQINYSYMSLDQFNQFMGFGELHIRLISLFVVINLAIFFIFIWRNLNYAARGVLYATFIYTVIVALVKFIE